MEFTNAKKQSKPEFFISETNINQGDEAKQSNSPFFINETKVNQGYKNKRRANENIKANTKYLDSIKESILSIDPKFFKAFKESTENNVDYVNFGLKTSEFNGKQIESKIVSKTALYNSFSTALKSKTVDTSTPGFKRFLKEHNNIQHNRFKRWLGIEKDPLNLTSNDKIILNKIINSEKESVIFSLENDLKENKKEVALWVKLDSYNETTKELKSNIEELHAAKKDIAELNKPLLKVVEKIIDLDLKNIRSFIKENKISIKNLINFVFDLIGKKLFPEDKIIMLHETLEKIEKNNTKDLNVTKGPKL